jgi:SsrA-binding protein
MKTIATNRAATFEYFVVERYEAGICLEGAEVKSLRAGNCNLKDSFCFIRGNTVLLKNMHIAVYDKVGAFNSKEAKRDRKLLLHKKEIAKIVGKVNEKGFTLIPLSLYFKEGLIKVELGLCRGKQTYDKKQSIKERDQKRDMERQIKSF